MSSATANQHHSGHDDHEHTTPKTYVKIAIILAIVTLAELIYPYATEDIEALHALYMPILGVMSAFKFFTVVGYYMHLKFDPGILKQIFTFSLIVATLFMVAFLFLFHVVI